MTAQEQKRKLILDATAGFRMMWFNKHEPHTIYLDQRPECEPDIVGDFRDLKQFPDGTFRLIVFDPPHILKTNDSENSDMVRKFGYLVPETWKSDLKRGFAELWRVLAPLGVLLLKWSNFSIQSNEILDLFPLKPLFYQITANRSQRISGKLHHGKECEARTLWFCFMKLPEEAQQP